MIWSFYTQSKDPKAKTGNDKQSVFMGAQSVFMASLDILFSSNHNIHKSSYGFCIRASDPLLIDFAKRFQLKGLKPINKGHTNFFECCDLTKKIYLGFLVGIRFSHSWNQQQFFPSYFLKSFCFIFFSCVYNTFTYNLN